MTIFYPQLSPALRNRFTEIWCPLSGDRDDMVAIMEHNLNQQVKLGDARASGIANAIMDFIEWFSNNDFGKRYGFQNVNFGNMLTWFKIIPTSFLDYAPLKFFNNKYICPNYRQKMCRVQYLIHRKYHFDKCPLITGFTVHLY